MTEKTFKDLGLGPKVEAAVEAAGYTVPTPIQEAAIPVALTGRDVLGIAQTGTGKTASFTLPMISLLERGRARARMPRSLILAPTRELAAQVAEAFEKYGANHRLNLALLIGGVSMDEQIRKLDRGVDVLIATPGRLLDHLQRGRIMLMGVEILVIDEADRMLDMGFIPDIEKICKMLPPRRQTLFFSATMPGEIQRLVDQFLNDPVKIEVAPPATTAKTITQRFCYCPEAEDWAKRERLRELLRSEPVKNAIVFCNRKRDVAILLKSLTKHGFNAGALHGDMDQSSRMATLAAFRAGDISILAASDVAARGLDIPDVSHVFNFDVPWAADDYVHRIGRTGRAGREGFSATLVGPDDIRLIGDIEKLVGEAPVWIGVAPTEEEIADAMSRKKRGRGRSAGASAGRGSGRSSGSGRGTRSGSRLPRSDEPASEAVAPVAAEENSTAPQSEGERSGRPPRHRRSRDSGRSGGEAANVADTAAVAREHDELGVGTQESGPEMAAAPGGHASEAPNETAGRRPRSSRRRNEAQPDAPRDSRDDRPAPRSGSAKGERQEPRKPAAASKSQEKAFAGHVPAFLQRPVKRTDGSTDAA